MRAKPLFSFAVIADTHVNAAEDRSPSPWPVNALANARARAAVSMVRGQAPSFVVHLGDIVHPLPGHDGYEAAMRNAAAIFDALPGAHYFIPGNHDIGDKMLGWSPADTVSPDKVDAYRSRFGADYHFVDRDGCRLVFVNSQTLTDGGGEAAAQWRWLEECFAGAAGRRLFVFTHYPPFIARADEPEHYDNLGEPVRSRLLELAAAAGVEALFSGHVHNYFCNRHGGMSLYVAPATSAIRHDYADLSDVPPVDGCFGRDDAAKLGFFMVDVYEEGHRVRLIRTHGACEAPQAPAPVAIGHAEGGWNILPRFGVDLRHDWSREKQVMPGGAVDEFVRKPARNDYLIPGLEEAGVMRLRVPVNDLLDPSARARCDHLGRMGFRFLVQHYGAPSGAAADAIRQSAAFLDGVEAILPNIGDEEALDALARFQHSSGLPVFVSPLRPAGDSGADGETYIHAIAHGFDALKPIPFGRFGDLAGCAVRVGQRDDPFATIAAAAAQGAAAGRLCQIHLALGHPNPAIREADAVAHCNRLVLALLAVAAHESCIVWMDTAIDIDRGYYPRLGLLDRRMNPTPASATLGRLGAVLARATRWRIEEGTAEPGLRLFRLADAESATAFTLVLASGPVEVDALPLRPGECVVELTTGANLAVAESGRKLSGPMLIAGDSRSIEGKACNRRQ